MAIMVTIMGEIIQAVREPGGIYCHGEGSRTKTTVKIISLVALRLRSV